MDIMGSDMDIMGSDMDITVMICISGLTSEF